MHAQAIHAQFFCIWKYLLFRTRTDFEKFWKFMEIENATFLDLESFGKESIFKMATEKF